MEGKKKQGDVWSDNTAGCMPSETASFGLQQVTCQHILGIELKFIALLLINNKSVCGSRAELIMLQNIPIILLGTSPPPQKTPIYSQIILIM